MTNILSKNQAAKSPALIASQVTGIMLALERQLAMKDSTIAKGIKNCIDHQTPGLKIIKEIQEMIQDNYSEMSLLLGGNLTETIKNFINV